MKENAKAALVVALCMGFYLGGGCNPPPTKVEKEIVENIVIRDVDLPYLPDACKEALVYSTQTLLKIDEGISRYDALVNECMTQASIDYEMAEREIVVIEAYNRYQEEGPRYSEEQIETAFEECELEYEDTDYCDEILEDYLEDVVPESER